MNQVAPTTRHKPALGPLGTVLAIFGQRSIDRIGKGTRLCGRPHVVNDGFIEVGERCLFSSRPIQSHLLAMPGAHIKIGNGVRISYGAGLSAMSGIDIGDGTQVGPYCIMLDNDFHKVGDLNAPGLAAPIEIGRGVVIGARVTVLRGSRIGDGAQIMSGTTVSGVVPAGSIVAGVPGKDMLRKCTGLVSGIMTRTFGLRVPPGVDDGPEQIPAWTAAGATRLLLAIEEALSITLPEDRFRAARHVGDVCAQVVAAAKLQGFRSVL